MEARAAALRRLLDEYPRDSEARGNLSQTLSNLGEEKESRRVLREGLQLDPNDETALNVESYSLARDGDLQGALRDNDRYAELRPGDPNPVDTRGDFEGALAGYRQAVLQLARAGEKQGAGNVLPDFALLSMLLGRRAAALEFVQQQKLDGDEAPTLAVLYLSAGNAAAAQQAWRSYAASHPWESDRGRQLKENAT